MSRQNIYFQKLLARARGNAATAVTLVTQHQSISPKLCNDYIEVQMDNCGKE
jgi:hypothetical protein